MEACVCVHVRLTSSSEFTMYGFELDILVQELSEFFWGFSRRGQGLQSAQEGPFGEVTN